VAGVGVGGLLGWTGSMISSSIGASLLNTRFSICSALSSQ
jgi:hypothetical protein